MGSAVLVSRLVQEEVNQCLPAFQFPKNRDSLRSKAITDL